MAQMPDGICCKLIHQELAAHLPWSLCIMKRKGSSCSRLASTKLRGWSGRVGYGTYAASLCCGLRVGVAKNATVHSGGWRRDNAFL
jgi:hypothetical protein